MKIMKHIKHADEQYSEEKKPTKRKKSVVREYAEALIIAVVLALLIRTFIVEAFKIPSGSMIPTLLIGDHLLVNKFIYRFTDPKRHDIVVFKYPDDPSRNFIKRVIGVGGDTLEIRDKVVYINGEPQKESYVQYMTQEIFPSPVPRDNFGPVTVPPNAFFMMGDNRDSSLDSRFWNNRFVERRALVGKALVIYWSWNQNESISEDPQASFITKILQAGKTLFYYVMHFPSSVRWSRLARVIR